MFEKFFANDVLPETHFQLADIDHYVDLNGARTRKQYTLWDRQVEAGDPERTGCGARSRTRCPRPEIEAALRDRLQKGLEMRRQRQRRELAGADVSPTRCSTPTSTATRSSRIPTHAARC